MRTTTRNAAITAFIALAISLGCLGAYRIAGGAAETFVDALPDSFSPIQYEDELVPVYIHGGFNPPDQARYAERKQAAYRRMQMESNSDPDIWAVVLRDHMLANEYGHRGGDNARLICTVVTANKTVLPC